MHPVPDCNSVYTEVCVLRVNITLLHGWWGSLCTWLLLHTACNTYIYG